MRMLFVFLFFLPFAQTGQQVNAQNDYVPFAIEGATWIVWARYESNVYPYLNRIEGDTVYDGRLYKKMIGQSIIHTGDFSTFGPEYQVAADKRVIGLFRDDTLRRKVYGIVDYQFCPDVDTLLYDFSLEVGDTVRTCSGAQDDLWEPIVVDSISTAVIDGISRKQLHYNYGLQDIEGVGSTVFPLWFQSTEVFVSNATAFLFDYCSSASNPTCATTLVNAIRNQENNLEVFCAPNPAREHLIVGLPNFVKAEIEWQLVDQLGVIIRHGKSKCSVLNNERNQFELPVDDLPKGIYILNLFTGNKRGATRFVKL